MGEVFLAEDTKLGRQVAIKILPEHLAADQDRRERFELEARAVASLNHPNIVTIHSVEHAVPTGQGPSTSSGQALSTGSGQGVHFLTMEFVDGKPLADVIPPSGMPIDEFLRITIPLADAVAAAHQKGVVHRDLKPANVVLTSDGRVKVLDFGLAKLRDEQPGDAANLPTRELTGEGRIVGTVAYMSPEQAAGRPVDHRSDIFSLGVVMYQMATGAQPFTGDTSVAIISSVLKDTPRSVTEINRALPRPLGHIIKTCLQKDPERRYQSAKDLRNELQSLKEDLGSGELAAAGDVPLVHSRPSRLGPVTIGAGLVALAIAGYFAVNALRSPAPPRLLIAAHTQLTSEPGQEIHPSISADGKWIVYEAATSGNSDIYLRSVGGQTAINLTRDSPAADQQPAFSPDGEHIAFRSSRDGGGIFVMGRTGEAPRRVTDRGFSPAWSPDGKEIVFSTVATTLPSSRGCHRRTVDCRRRVGEDPPAVGGRRTRSVVVAQRPLHRLLGHVDRRERSETLARHRHHPRGRGHAGHVHPRRRRGLGSRVVAGRELAVLLERPRRQHEPLAHRCRSVVWPEARRARTCDDAVAVCRGDQHFRVTGTGLCIRRSRATAMSTAQASIPPPAW